MPTNPLQGEISANEITAIYSYECHWCNCEQLIAVPLSRRRELPPGWAMVKDGPYPEELRCPNCAERRMYENTGDQK